MSQKIKEDEEEVKVNGYTDGPSVEIIMVKNKIEHNHHALRKH